MNALELSNEIDYHLFTDKEIKEQRAKTTCPSQISLKWTVRILNQKV